MAGDIIDGVEYEDVTDAALDGEEDADQQELAEAAKELVPISKRKKSEQFRIHKKNVMTDLDASSSWRAQALMDDGFVAGEQMSAEDKELLNAQQRPLITYNRTLTILKAICGMEINGRYDIDFKPRDNADTESNEILSAASKWMGDGCDAEDEHSQAFRQAAICGIGALESRFSYEDSRDGNYVDEQIDSREMVWDRKARKKGLLDAKRQARIRRMPLCDAMEMFPGKTKYQLDATWASGMTVDEPVRGIEEKRIRDGKDSYEEYDDTNEVTVVCVQWIEKEPYWVVADPDSNQLIEVNDVEHEQLKAALASYGMNIDSEKMYRKVYKQCFLGSEYLKGGDAPAGNRFSWSFITGDYDAAKRQWFGLVRVVRDPQMWANKFMSQVMYIMNSTAKGGILAETDAFDDERDAEESYAASERITWLAKGALSGGKPKLMAKPGQGDPSAYVNLLQYAVTSIKDVTGINAELLGQQDMQNPGVVENMRKQAGMTVLATLFDSKRSFLKQVGKIRLYFIQTRMSDGRLIRVVGPGFQPQAVQLAKENTTGTYDVVVDDAPTSPNQKEANWAIIQPMLGVFKDQLMGSPDVLVEVLRYSPLPSQLVGAISKVIQQKSNDPKVQQEQDQLKQLTVQKLVAEINKDQSTAELNNSKAGATQATATYDIAMARNMLEDNNFNGLKQYIAAQEAAANASKAGAESGLIAAKIERERAGIGHDAVASHTKLLDAHTKNLAVRHGVAQDHVDTASGAHLDAAKALQARVAAHVAMKMSNQPQQGTQ